MCISSVARMSLITSPFTRPIDRQDIRREQLCLRFYILRECFSVPMHSRSVLTSLALADGSNLTDIAWYKTCVYEGLIHVDRGCVVGTSTGAACHRMTIRSNRRDEKSKMPIRKSVGYDLRALGCSISDSIPALMDLTEHYSTVLLRCNQVLRSCTSVWHTEYRGVGMQCAHGEGSCFSLTVEEVSYCSKWFARIMVGA